MQSAGDHKQRDDIGGPNPGDPPLVQAMPFPRSLAKQLGAQNSHHQYDECDY